MIDLIIYFGLLVGAFGISADLTEWLGETMEVNE